MCLATVGFTSDPKHKTLLDAPDERGISLIGFHARVPDFEFSQLREPGRLM